MSVALKHFYAAKERWGCVGLLYKYTFSLSVNSTIGPQHAVIATKYVNGITAAKCKSKIRLNETSKKEVM